MMTFTELVAFNESKNAINKIIDANPECCFKIGKTSQPLETRFSQGYEDEYDNIHLIYMSTDGELIDKLEKELIQYYMNNYPTRCDNQQVGGGPDEEGIAPVGRIYLVIRN